MYTHGHLLVVGFSLVLALAYALAAIRVPGLRRDLGFAATFGLIALSGVCEMRLTLHPSVFAARADLAVLALLLVVVSFALFVKYGDDLLDAERRRRLLHATAGYVGAGLVISLLLLVGAFDRGQLRYLEIRGARSAMVVLHGGPFTFLFLYACVFLALAGSLMLPAGPRQRERRTIVGGLALVPLMTLHELLIGLGHNPMVPLGAYFACVSELIAAVIVVEHLRMLVGAQVVGKYTIERRLGGGGMADVFVARQVVGGNLGVVRRIALKRMRSGYAENPEFVRLFLHEAKLAARLAHPNIVQLHDVGQESGELYLAMELVEGPTLARLLAMAQGRKHPLGSAVAVEIGVQLAEALAYAHTLRDEQGRPLEIVHRDVTPQNVLVTAVGHVKLTDFGIACSAERAPTTTPGVVRGKMAYVAPEQLRGLPFDHRADLYALGVLLFQIVSGMRALQPDSDAGVLEALRAGRTPYRDVFIPGPETLVAVIRRLLEPDPALRFETAEELRRALQPLRTEAAARERLGWLVAMSGTGPLPRRPEPHPPHTQAA